MKKIKTTTTTTGEPNTHLAAEFHVLSSLYRIGLEAHLTLGNHKSVDILIKKDNGDIVTIDVKGAITADWRMGMKQPLTSPKHYYVLVNYRNTIRDTQTSPALYIIHSTDIDSFLTHSEIGGFGVSYRKVRDNGKQYLNNWEPFLIR